MAGAAALRETCEVAGKLDLYTDASVRGALLPKPAKPRRRRVGPGFAAWAGWHDCERHERPTLAGLAYLGDERGTQTAEFGALLHGLSAVLGYAEPRAPRMRPDVLNVHVDNRCVYMLMIGEWKPSQLGGYYRAATDLTSRLFGLGVSVGYVKVPEKDATHRLVHSMSAQAHAQVLVRPDWRPSDPRPVPKSAPPVAGWPDDDIPF